MIVSRIDGGLGNQMFQYAYAWYLARSLNCQLWLDTRAYATEPAHGYLLDRFQIAGRVAVDEVLRCLPARYRPGGSSERRNGLLTRMQEFVAKGRLRRHKESPFGFHPRHLKIAAGRYLVGYWQSELYFPGMRSELLGQFRLREPLSAHSGRILERIRATNSLALHIRRGDYITSPAAADLYCHLGLDYYRAAVEDWGRAVGKSQLSPEVFVFSNDIPWCRQQFSLPWKTTFVDHGTPDLAHEEMVLMSAAQRCAIANSTFSWWAAWLNERPGHVIYAPARWFQPGTLNEANIVPVRWRRLPSMGLLTGST